MLVLGWYTCASQCDEGGAQAEGVAEERIGVANLCDFEGKGVAGYRRGQGKSARTMDKCVAIENVRVKTR